VTWQVGAFGLLAVALAAGFAWYERERPDARIVALVGTLAAFAALGRIAFAAVPNVKPTTDIVLIAGYALGGGPGFAVGALAGLSSNFFFGQGPWTPWQMAAWGVAGAIGAGLARLMSVRAGTPPPPMGRWPLAIVCCVVGFGFTVMQDIGDWVSYSDHSSAQLGVYVGQGLGFDAVHAAGCLGFALALGPALTRSIQRFARRLQVNWIPPTAPTNISPTGVAAALIAILIVGAALGPRPPAARAAATPPAHAAAASPAQAGAAAVSYLLGAENSDGGFGGAPGQASDQLYSGWAALGLASAGKDLNQVVRGPGLMAYIGAGAGSPSDVGALERTILVVHAAGLSARHFAGHDLVAALQRRFRHDGSIADQVNLTSFAVLALRGAGIGAGAATMRWLARQQDRDGGFSFAGAGGSSDVDDTGAALEALAGDGGAAGVRARAVAFLRSRQARDGGFPSQPGTASNAQSTAWAIQGLDAAGVSPVSLHRGGAISPLAYLDSLVALNGAVRYSRGVTQTPVWVTGEALMAMEGKPLPIAAPAAAPRTAAASPSPRAAPSPSAPGGHRRRRSRPITAATARRPASGRPRYAAGAAPIAGGVLQVGRLETAVGALTALVLAPIGLG
jgi:energy-coupling factor transport system substrate-specific component